MPRKATQYDDDSLVRGVNPVALMYDERTWWLSCDKLTVSVTTKKTQHGLTVVTDGPPIVRRFINQPARNLERWMKSLGGFAWRRLT